MLDLQGKPFENKILKNPIHTLREKEQCSGILHHFGNQN
jgi:hypothetical protein